MSDPDRPSDDRWAALRAEVAAYGDEAVVVSLEVAEVGALLAERDAAMSLLRLMAEEVCRWADPAYAHSYEISQDLVQQADALLAGSPQEPAEEAP